MGKADRYQKLYPVTWDQLHRDAKALGMAPSGTGTVQGHHRRRPRRDHGGEEVLKAIEGDGDGWLVVDDLVDTGNTATIIRNMLPKAHFATLYSKPAGKPLVDTFITEVSQDTWILFPWDSEVQYTAPLVEQN